VDNTGDVVDESTGSGTDTVRSSITFNLADTAHVKGQVENLTLTGTSAINGTGNALNNVIVGNSGNNTLAGGTGTDTVSYENAMAQVVVNLATTGAQNTGGAGTDVLSGFENLTGSQFNDTLTGNQGNNVLTGLGGDDLLNGAAGADTMVGGLGNDKYVVDNTGDVVDESSGGGIDTVQSSITFSLADATHAKGSIENLTLTGTSAINGTGNPLDNVITGNSGNNVLAGLAGSDTLDGGAGADTATYAASPAGVTVSLMTGLGTDGFGTVDTLKNIENLMGSNANDTLEGNAGANVLNGGGGSNTVSYEHATAGVTVNLGTTKAQNTGGAGADTVSNFLNLIGSAFNDTLTGTTGANTIDGGGGNDTIAGGSGADTFKFGPNFGHDTIKDFTPAQGDVIQFNQALFTNFSAMMQNNTKQVGTNTVITDTAGDTLSLTNVTASTLQSKNFATRRGASQRRCRSPGELLLEIDLCERVAVGVTYDVATLPELRVRVIDRPGRREATCRHDRLSCFRSHARLSCRAACSSSNPASKYLAWAVGCPLPSSSTTSLRCSAICRSPFAIWSSVSAKRC